MSDIAILTYWDGRGNGESIRLMMAAAGQQWEERVYKNDADHLSTFDDLKVMFDDGVLAFDQVIYPFVEWNFSLHLMFLYCCCRRFLCCKLMV